MSHALTTATPFPPTSGACGRSGFKSVPELKERKRSEGMESAFVESIRSLEREPTRGLLRHLAVTEDALTLWALHLLLDRRDVPPCLRSPRRDETAQLSFITWLADLFWFVKRNPAHKPLFNRWRGLFTKARGSDEWHGVAAWAYGSGHQVGYYHAKGLALTEEQKQPLMTMISNSMRANRDLLRRLPELHERILADAILKPDRSRRHTSVAVAERRTELLRLYLLAGRNQTLAAGYHLLLSGQQLTRQALSRQLEAVEVATKLRLLSSRSKRAASPPKGGVYGSHRLGPA